MQTKASMIIPCYNKELYIAKTLECVQNQEWDNIEVIIINDGSTDGTREIVAQWEPKLVARGYEVVIIDQDNLGVAATVKNSLIRATGEYICIPDADDAFSPHYVSHMAKVLDDRNDVDWVWCNIPSKSPLLEISRKELLVQLLLLHKHLFWSVCMKMYRKSYIDKCGVIEKYIDSRLTQEPQFFIPLAAGGSFPYLLCENLYFYHTAAVSSIMTNSRKKRDNILAFWQGYRDLQIEVLKAHDLNSESNECAVEIAFLENVQRDFFSLQNKKWIDLSHQLGGMRAENVDASLQEYVGTLGFELIFGVKPKTPNDLINALAASQRIICCCCLGSCGRKLLPQLAAIGITPDLYWDAGAENNQHLDTGYTVQLPDYASLGENDLLLILSEIGSNIDDIRDALGDKVKSFSVREIKSYIRWKCYDIFKK